MTGAIIKKPNVTCIDGRDLVLGTGENKFTPANRLDFPDEFVVRSDPRVLITGYARGNIIAHGRKSPFDQVPDSTTNDARGPDIEHRGDKWFVFEEIDWPDGRRPSRTAAAEAPS